MHAVSTGLGRLCPSTLPAATGAGTTGQGAVRLARGSVEPATNIDDRANWGALVKFDTPEFGPGAGQEWWNGFSDRCPWVPTANSEHHGLSMDELDKVYQRWVSGLMTSDEVVRLHGQEVPSPKVGVLRWGVGKPAGTKGP